MKKILFIGIGNEKDEKQRMTSALIEKGLEYVYTRWSDLSFFGDKIYACSREINLDEIGGVFFDIPRFPTTIKVAGKVKERIDFHLENEMHTLLTILKKKKIYAPNSDFFLSHPYYNKFSQAYIFAGNGVAAIPTLHLCDNKKQKIAEIFAATNFDFPIVAKESYGGQGNKVWKIENQIELEEFIKDRRNVNVIFQPFVENNADYRVIVVGGECLGIMKRSAKEGEWKNNFSLGGEVAKHDDEEMQKFAIEACRKMNLDIAGLDIFSTDNGYLIIEANMFFGLDGFESVFQDLNVSGKILEMIINKTK
jgi:RimK family alpha-L-glutamate ligase